MPRPRRCGLVGGPIVSEGRRGEGDRPRRDELAEDDVCVAHTRQMWRHRHRELVGGHLVKGPSEGFAMGAPLGEDLAVLRGGSIW